MKTVDIPNADKLILDLCGGTGSWSRPYSEAGYQVANVTLPDYDVRDYQPPENVYGILAAPPCTMFSFARTSPKIPRNLHEGMELVEACLRIIWECQYRLHSQFQQKPPLAFWALENPNGMLNWFLGHPVFTFHPYEFGDLYTKKTCLWGHFNIPIKTYQQRLPFDNVKFDHFPLKDLEVKSINHKEFWKDKKNRQELRSITPYGFARAFFEANK